MTDTYCGKNCSECTQKEILDCPGCKTGPGRLIGGDCELARCCRSKGHEACDTCDFKWNCDTFRGKSSQLTERKRKMEAELLRQQGVAKRAPILGKWLWPLFWLIVPAIITGIMESDVVAAIAPGVFVVGSILSVVCRLVYCAILLKVSSEEERYRTAGICGLVGFFISMVVQFVFGGATWTVLRMLPAAIVSTVGEYNEYMAHSVVLTGCDDVLSAKWQSLWKWYIGMILGMFGSIVIMLLIPILGALLLLGGAIGICAVSITKLVYLYKTAKTFREYQPDDIIFSE